ncbi:hypothetical protein Pint_29831 [Pistacia integerrima]|uniref:Uncharacterized protein n=1 Tax=Pistacia integerrima TaxID=434235 RepID=A0ACC0X3J9_9ROSI|nr:hypothetical protein Pint_29831 [Pistacia integerrima]
MAGKGTNRILLSFSCLILLFGVSYSQTNKLLQSQLLKDGDQLVSAFGNFRLGFFSPKGTTNRYLGIWYYRPQDWEGQQQYGGQDCYKDYFSSQCALNNRIQPVWVANRNTPILDKSGSLTVNSTNGNLQILHKSGNPIVISPVRGASNTSAILEKSGNFILYEMNSVKTIFSE